MSDVDEKAKLAEEVCTYDRLLSISDDEDPPEGLA